jgi:hypothetical protein
MRIKKTKLITEKIGKKNDWWEIVLEGELNQCSKRAWVKGYEIISIFKPNAPLGNVEDLGQLGKDLTK